MSCLVWNCRGIGNATIVRDLCALVKEAGSHIVSLSETRQKVEKVRCLRSRLGLKGFVGVNSEGMSGGLALFWHKSVCMEVNVLNKRFIDAYVRLVSDGPVWHVTFVYGEPRVEHRHRMWDLLKAIKQSSPLPWLVWEILMWPSGSLSTFLLTGGVNLICKRFGMFCKLVNCLTMVFQEFPLLMIIEEKDVVMFGCALIVPWLMRAGGTSLAIPRLFT